jgi:hypothetical protein
MIKIDFRPDVPVDLALAFPEGKLVKSRFKGEQIMFSSVDGRVAFVSQADGHQIQHQLRELGIRSGQRILICKERSFGPAGQVTAWKVYRAGEPPIGEQRDGSFVVPAQPGASTCAAAILHPPPAIAAVVGKNAERGRHAPVETPTADPLGVSADSRSPSKSNGASRPSPELHQGWAQLLLGQVNALSDVYALALAHAQQYPGISSDDVRAFVLVAFHQREHTDVA